MKLVRTAALAVAALLVVGLTACGNGDNGGGNGGGNGGNGITANFTVDGNTATVRWEKCDGASGYSIEKSPSRYGEYEYLDYVDGTEYETNDVNSYYKVTAFMKNGESLVVGTYSYETELFGKNTFIYSPADDVAEIQKDLDTFYNKTDGTKEGEQGRARGEFSEDRFAALFKAGNYDLDVNMGYYTSLSGLGVSPDDVTISKINADAEISLCNFWRTAENLSVDGNMLWAVSQATSLRRVHVKGDLSLSGSGSTSGGFLADTKVDGKVNSGSQQQWFSRNSYFGGWSGGVWNMAFAGVEGESLPVNCWNGTGKNYTCAERCGTTCEKPFLTYDSDYGYRVYVPETEKNSRGVSWDGTGGASGSFLPLDEFYVARSDRDTAKTINAALSEGKNLILTAGIYELDAPLEVGSGTVVLGLGLATLRPSDGNRDTLMRISDTDGVYVGSLLFDAGKHTETLLEVGQKSGYEGNPAAYAALSDLFFRVGGAKEINTSVDVCVEINGNNVIGDNFWIWRADHWDGVGWNKNKADTGIIINGDNASFYGLFVEHFQKYQTIWNGNGGTTYFYQSELPYDVPDAVSWSPEGVINGYASYYVSDSVTSHTAYSLGVYSYLRDAAVTLDNAIVCPKAAGIKFYHMVTVWLSGNPNTSISSVINGYGGVASKDEKVQSLESYVLPE